MFQLLLPFLFFTASCSVAYIDELKDGVKISASASRGAFSDGILLEWSCAEPSVSFAILRGDSSSGLSAHSTLKGQASLKDTSALPGKDYSYRIDVLGASGRVVGSSEVFTGFRAHTSTASAPTGFQVINRLSPSKISLEWLGPPSQNYRIYRNDALIADLPGGNSYEDTGLAPGTAYNYKISAAYAAGEVFFGGASLGAATAVSGTTLTE